MDMERVRRKLIFASTLIGVLALWSGSYVGADGGDEHQTEQTEPIPLGVSGGSIDDSSSAFCCGGTLGALVQDIGGVQYILSNNHVLARANQGNIGDLIVQPGLIDVDPVCTEVPSDAVANLSDFVPIDFNLTNLVDAAIAEVIPGRVDPSGTILDIGLLSPAILAPSLGLAVQKSGRTTGLTQGQISAVDVTVNVSIPTKCGPGRGKSATFINQFRITPGNFSAGGDSGSLIVEDVASLPQAVGLLFAGSSTSTLANPIDNVLSAFGVSMIGGSPPPPPATGSISGAVESAVDASPLTGATVEVDTGESATTAADGTYAIADVPIGSRSVTASAPGFVSETQSPIIVDENLTTENVDFALEQTIVGTQAIVDCITYSTAGGKNGDKHLHVTVKIVDDFGMPVAGASVSVDVLGLGSATGTTDSAGEVTFVANNAADTCYETDVTAVVASGLSFDGSEPANGFLKGTDTTPDADCRSGSDSCGGVPFTDTILTSGTGKLRAAIGAKRQNEHSFFSISNKVVGVGVGVANGEAVIEVYLASHDAGVIAQLPDHVENVSVRAVVTGEFVGY